METSSKYLDIFNLHFLPIKKFPQVCFVEKKISFPNYVSLFLQIIEINVEQFATKCWNCAKKKHGKPVGQKLARQVTLTYSTFQPIHMDFLCMDSQFSFADNSRSAFVAFKISKPRYDHEM